MPAENQPEAYIDCQRIGQGADNWVKSPRKRDLAGPDEKPL